MILKSVKNFRDIGGISLNGHGKIKEGLIYRSATVDGISRRDIKILNSLNIRTIIDLRAPTEAKKFRNKIEGIETVYLTLDFQQTTRERINPYLYKRGSDEILADISNQLYIEILDEAVPVFKQLVELLSGGDAAPLLIHCQAGKDRTGIIIALLLLLFGADKDQIKADFLRSNDELMPYFRKMLIARQIMTFGYFPAGQMLNVVKVKERNINSVLDRIESRYKGVEGYLASAGFDISKVPELRSKLCTL